MLKTFTPATYERVDERGRFVEIIAEGNWQSVIHGEMKVGAVMGNHYHCETRIYFYVTRGEVDVDVCEIGTGERKRVHLTGGKGLYLEPGESHAIRFRQASEFILLKSKRYDPADPDTFPYVVEESAV
jgi:quercetin dioxygenase-like cupin family protein